MPSTSKKKRSKGRNSVQYERARARVLQHNRICQFRGNDKHPPCGQLIDLDLKWPDPMSATVDHIVPVSQMEWDDPRTYDPEFLIPMHLVCNQRKGDGSHGRKEPKHKTSRDWLA